MSLIRDVWTAVSLHRNSKKLLAVAQAADADGKLSLVRRAVQAADAVGNQPVKVVAVKRVATLPPPFAAREAVLAQCEAFNTVFGRVHHRFF